MITCKVTHGWLGFWHSIILVVTSNSCGPSLHGSKAVDLYVLERAFLSTHIDSEPLVNELIAAYGAASKRANKTLSRLEVVRQRGRKREMIG